MQLLNFISCRIVFPYFVKVPGDSSVKTGYTARLECAASGYPVPQISWQKDGGNDFPAAQERRMKVMAKDDVFFIVNVKLVDMGVYSCTAKNVAGMAASNATLTVLGINLILIINALNSLFFHLLIIFCIFFVLEPPWFGNAMYDKQVKVGEEVVLECMSYGSPKPKIKWSKDGVPVLTSNRHFFTAEDQLLVIMEANVDDSGTYECEISNSLGTKVQGMEIQIMPCNILFCFEAVLELYL